MRKLLISILLASAAVTPALAAPRDNSDREQARADRQQAREDRQQAREEARPERSNEVDRSQYRPERQTVSERPQFTPPPAPVQVQRQNFAGRPVLNDRNASRDARLDAARTDRAQRVDQIQQRLDQARDHPELGQSSRPLPRVLRDRVPVVSNEPRPG